MKQLRLFFLLLTPSPLGVVITSLAAVSIVTLANWSYALNNSFLGDFLYGSGGIITKFSGPTNKVSVYANAFSAQYLTYEVVVFIVAIVFAFIVYLILQVASRTLGNVHDTVGQLHGLRGSSKHALEFSVGLRLAVRCLALVLWFFYWMLTLKILLPYCILATQLTLEEIFSSTVWLYGLLGILVMAVTIHVHVILARLTLLRPRLFGGSEAVELAILDTKS